MDQRLALLGGSNFSAAPFGIVFLFCSPSALCRIRQWHTVSRVCLQFSHFLKKFPRPHSGSQIMGFYFPEQKTCNSRVVLLIYLVTTSSVMRLSRSSTAQPAGTPTPARTRFTGPRAATSLRWSYLPPYQAHPAYCRKL